MPPIKDSKIKIRERITPYLTIERSCKSIVQDKDEHTSQIVQDDGPFGLCLFMDGYIQSAEKDSHIYHESLVQPAMCLADAPKKVLIGGGGELVTAHEVLKHKSVQRCDMIDIDGKVVDMAKKQLEKLHFNSYKDSRLNLVIDDVYKFVEAKIEENEKLTKESKEVELYDVIIMDICDPTEGYGPARLYTENFYQMLKKILTADGVFVTQSTALQHTLFMSAARIRKTAASVFGDALLYRSFVPSFLENWGFTIARHSFTVPNDSTSTLAAFKTGTLKPKNQTVDTVLKTREVQTSYYDSETHAGMFCCLGKDLNALIYGEDVQIATDANMVMYLSIAEASERMSETSPSSASVGQGDKDADSSKETNADVDISSKEKDATTSTEKEKDTTTATEKKTETCAVLEKEVVQNEAVKDEAVKA